MTHPTDHVWTYPATLDVELEEADRRHRDDRFWRRIAQLEREIAKLRELVTSSHNGAPAGANDGKDGDLCRDILTSST